MELTVGQVSGIIAVGVVVVRFLFPNLVVFLFLGTLTERNDSTRANAISCTVSISVVVFRCLGLAGTLLISIAAVVTPLGLYEAVVPDPRPQMQPFHHAVDYGIFGQGTPPRNESLPWTRNCYDGSYTRRVPVTCSDLTRELPPRLREALVDVSVPDETIALFSSGLSADSSTISSIGDIQWRSWTLLRYRHPRVPDLEYTRFNISYPAGLAQEVGVLALTNKYELIEGLVVDTKDGGIGFRNHSVPPLTPHWSTWAEDLLFVQPVTACVDTNLTLEYTVPQEDITTSLGSATEITLVDRGGFVNLDHTAPEWDRSKMQSRHEDIWARAYQAAWYNNIYAMKMLNVSKIHVTDDPNDPIHIMGMNSTLGQRFSIGPDSACSGLEYPRYISIERYGCFLWRNLEDPIEDWSRDPPAQIKFNCDLDGWYNPGMGKLDHIGVYCGLVLGAARPLDGPDEAADSEDNLIVLPGSKWVKPIYTCTTAAEARIKTVIFAFNTTDDLSGLTVRKIANKEYADEQDKPLWGVENFQHLSPAERPRFPRGRQQGSQPS
ncbi:hypothetical protein BJY00DRAFT_310478 [Aspergillus carlsbadensis]|nr:hypothetical protein BJY00DRAFT_310478 [Aspergillus carlsbadensis]